MSTQPAEQPSLWMKWRLPCLIAVGVLIIVFTLYLARAALFPFIVSIVLAELLYPFVEFLERWIPGRRRFPGVARVVSILLIYVLFIALVALILYLTLSSIISEGSKFIESLPQLIDQARVTIEDLYAQYSDRIPEEFITQIQGMIESSVGVIGDAALSVALSAISGVVSTVSFVIGLIIVPILLFYLLKDKDELLDDVYRPLAPGVEAHTRNVLGIIHGVIGSYIRAQLISVSVVGILVFVGLTLLGIEFALILGILAAIFAIIPIVGAIIGAVPGVLFALANDPDKVVWVLLVYVVAQLLGEQRRNSEIAGQRGSTPSGDGNGHTCDRGGYRRHLGHDRRSTHRRCGPRCIRLLPEAVEPEQRAGKRRRGKGC